MKETRNSTDNDWTPSSSLPLLGEYWSFESTIVPEGRMHIAEAFVLSSVLVSVALITPTMLAAALTYVVEMGSGVLRFF